LALNVDNALVVVKAYPNTVLFQIRNSAQRTIDPPIFWIIL
jgi:hypothetical protein